MKTLPFKNVVSLTLDFCPNPYPGGHILMLHWIVCTAGRAVGTQLSSVTIRFLSLSKHTIFVCCTPKKYHKVSFHILSTFHPTWTPGKLKIFIILELRYLAKISWMWCTCSRVLYRVKIRTCISFHRTENEIQKN